MDLNVNVTLNASNELKGLLMKFFESPEKPETVIEKAVKPEPIKVEKAYIPVPEKPKDSAVWTIEKVRETISALQKDMDADQKRNNMKSIQAILSAKGAKNLPALDPSEYESFIDQVKSTLS